MVGSLKEREKAEYFILMICFMFAEIQGESLTVDFPEQKNWTGLVSEMEIVAGADSGNPLSFK